MGKISRPLLLLFAIGLLLYQQVSGQSYPVKIPEGTSREIRAENQDFWVLKESQFDSALAHSRRMNILEEQVTQLRTQIQKMEARSSEYQALVDTLKMDRDFYQKNWKICEEDLETMSDMRDKEKRWKKVFKITTFAGIPIALLAGIFIL